MTIENVFSSLNSINHVSRVFGVSIFRNSERRNLTLLLIDTLFSLVNISIIVISVIAGIYKMCMEESLSWTLTYIFSYMFLWAFSTTTAIVSICSAMVYSHKKVMEATSKLNQVDKVLISQSKKFHSKIKYIIMLITSAGISFLATVLIYDIYLWFQKSHNKFMLIGFYLAHTINCITDIQFGSMVLLLWFRFRIINERIVKMYSNEIYRTNGGPQFMLRRENNISDINIGNWIDSNRSSQKENLFLLRKQFDELQDIAILVNSAFNIQLLFITPTILISITTYFYKALSMSSIRKHAIPESLETDHLLYINLLWATFFTTMIVFIASLCSIATNEAQKTTFILQTILLKEILNSEDTEELQMFSDHVTGRKLQFTAHGFFEIDASLLCSIAGAVTTYLVILVQSAY